VKTSKYSTAFNLVVSKLLEQTLSLQNTSLSVEQRMKGGIIEFQYFLLIKDSNITPRSILVPY
jgi:hypothetical protein